MHATFGSGIIFFHQLRGHSITDISKFVQDSTKFCSPHTILLRHIACATLIFPASCERLGQVYGVNQPGGLSGFCKRVGRDKNLTKYYNQHPI